MVCYCRRATFHLHEDILYVPANCWESWFTWERAMNIHYSFLHNIRNDRLGVFEFPPALTQHKKYLNFQVSPICPAKTMST